jgi:hypothetical protein
MKLEFHELANLFPLMTGDDAKALGDDIKANGQHEPIIMFEEKILDGRNRYLECIRVGVVPTFRPYLGDDPMGFVISLNLKRRHLDESQRAMVAKKIAALEHGQRQSGKFAGVATQADAAALLNVGERSVRSAGVVLDKGAPDLIKAVEQGEISVSAAAEFAKQPKEDQAKQIADAATPAAAVKASKLAAMKAAADRAEPVKIDDPEYEDKAGQVALLQSKPRSKQYKAGAYFIRDAVDNIALYADEPPEDFWTLHASVDDLPGTVELLDASIKKLAEIKAAQPRAKKAAS